MARLTRNRLRLYYWSTESPSALVNYLSAVDNRRDVSLIEWAMACVRALQFVRPPIVTGLAVFKTPP